MAFNRTLNPGWSQTVDGTFLPATTSSLPITTANTTSPPHSSRDKDSQENDDYKFTRSSSRSTVRSSGGALDLLGNNNAGAIAGKAIGRDWRADNASGIGYGTSNSRPGINDTRASNDGSLMFSRGKMMDTRGTHATLAASGDRVPTTSASPLRRFGDYDFDLPTRSRHAPTPFVGDLRAGLANPAITIGREHRADPLNFSSRASSIYGGYDGADSIAPQVGKPQTTSSVLAPLPAPPLNQPTEDHPKFSATEALTAANSRRVPRSSGAQSRAAIASVYHFMIAMSIAAMSRIVRLTNHSCRVAMCRNVS